MEQGGLYIAITILFIISTSLFLVIGPFWATINFIQDNKTRFNHKFMWFLAMIFWPLTQMLYSHKAKHSQLIWLFRVSSVLWVVTLYYIMSTNVELQGGLIKTRLNIH